MNTRLQVEHPVTEMITGLDLVELQIRIARGEKLPIKQEDLEINGHSIELRVYAEDSMNDFLPSVGFLSVYELPKGDGIRVDNGFEQGMDVPIYYDPMLSKLITYGKTRNEAIELMIQAIDNYHIEGCQTTLPFGKFVMEHEAFRSGNFDTHFVKNFYDSNKLKNQLDLEAEIAAYIALKQYVSDQKIIRLPINLSY
jgi:acetyl/propionyl-CoA carboxylase alpha subunit